MKSIIVAILKKKYIEDNTCPAKVTFFLSFLLWQHVYQRITKISGDNPHSSFMNDFQNSLRLLPLNKFFEFTPKILRFNIQKEES